MVGWAMVAARGMRGMHAAQHGRREALCAVRRTEGQQPRGSQHAGTAAANRSLASEC